MDCRTNNNNHSQDSFIFLFRFFLNGIVIHIIPLYYLLMSKNYSLVELVSSNNKNAIKDEFQMVTNNDSDVASLNEYTK